MGTPIKWTMLFAQVRSSQGLGRLVRSSRSLLVFSLLLAALPCAPLYAQTRAYVCITDNIGTAKSSSIGVVDIDTNTVTATIPLTGFQSLYLVAAPDGKHVYTEGQSLSGGEGQVFTIDTSTNTIVSQIPVNGIFVSRMTISSDGKTLYVDTSGSVTVIDIPSNSVTAVIGVGGFITGLAVTPNGARLYVTIANVPSQPGELVVVDTTTNTVVGTVSGTGALDSGVAITAKGSLVYSGSLIPGAVFVTSTSSNQVVAGPIPVDGPGRMAFSPNGAALYVEEPAAGKVAVIDTASNTVATVIDTGGSLGDLAFTPDGKSVYVTDAGSINMFVISTATNTVTTVVPLGSTPGLNGIAMVTLSTPFSEFKVKDLDIDRHNFRVTGSFTPGKASSGINPVNQAVILSLGDFSLTIPVGSFKPDQDRDDFHFTGRIRDVDVEFRISAEKSSEPLERRHNAEPEFKFSVEARDVEVGKQSNPVTLSLKIGNNEGTEEVNAH